MKQKTKEIKTCCICKKEYGGYGNNAEPVMTGRCCDRCNSKVIAVRLESIYGDKQ